MKRPGFLELRGPVNQSVVRLGAGLRSAGETLLAAVGRHPRVAGLLAPALEAERGAREREAIEADRTIAGLRTELDETRARAQSSLRELGERHQQLVEANQRLQAELAAARSAGSPIDDGWAANAGQSVGDQDSEAALRTEIDSLRRKERDLLVKANLLSQRVRELRTYADENAAMRNRLVDFDAALARADALQRRVKELEAREFAAEALATPALPAALTDGRGATMGASLDDSLAAVLRAFAGRVAVVADAHGLLMGGAGDRSLQENLAAVAGFVLETAERAAEFLPLGRPHRVELQYAGGIQLTARMFACDGEPMALTVLRPGDLTLDRPVEGAVASIVRLIGVVDAP